VAALTSGVTLIAPDIRTAKRLVVKIGSALLVDRKTGLKQNWLSALALDVVEAKTRGTDVVLVSSGSIALGRKVLNLGDGGPDAGTVPGRRRRGPNPPRPCL
jgi:glutamate 5-kinase